jgi:uncharacterized cupin superfamily protein
MKPVINLDELELVSEEDGPFQGQYGVIAERIGARKLGYSLTICPPGKKVCPFHNHRVNEEMFFILEGEGLLRFGDREYPLREHDVVACPPGGRDVAHQIINTGKTDLKYLALSTMDPHDICEYPDSDKVGVYAGKQGSRDLRLMFRAEQCVDYFDRETR